MVHTFHEAPGVVRFPIPEGYRVAEGCAREGIVWAQTDRTVIVSGLRELDGMALLLERG